MICDLIFSAQELLKIIPGLILFPLTFILASRKLGTNVSFSYTWEDNNLGGRFASIVLINKKDRPVVVMEVTAVYDGVEFQLERFTTPQILKPYEALIIEPSEYSYLKLNGERWEIPYSITRPFDLYLGIPGKRIKCIPLFLKRNIFRRSIQVIGKASKLIMRHNDKVYNPDKVSYILVYVHEGKKITTFIEKSGFISESHGLSGNMLSNAHLSSSMIAEMALQRANPGMKINVLDVGT